MLQMAAPNYMEVKQCEKQSILTSLCAESIEQLSSEPWQEKHCQNLIDRDLRHDFISFLHILYHGLKRDKSNLAASYKQCFFWWLQGHTLTRFNDLPLMPNSKFRDDIGVTQVVSAWFKPQVAGSSRIKWAVDSRSEINHSC